MIDFFKANFLIKYKKYIILYYLISLFLLLPQICKDVGIENFNYLYDNKFLVFINYPIINFFWTSILNQLFICPNYILVFLIYCPAVIFSIILLISNILKFINNSAVFNKSKFFIYFSYIYIIFDIINLLFILEKNNDFNYPVFESSLIYSLSKIDYALSQPFTTVASLFLHSNFSPSNYYYTEMNANDYFNRSYFIFILFFSPLWLRFYCLCNFIWLFLFYLSNKLKKVYFYLFLEIIIFIIFCFLFTTTISCFLDKNLYDFSRSLSY